MLVTVASTDSRWDRPGDKYRWSQPDFPHLSFGSHLDHRCLAGAGCGAAVKPADVGHAEPERRPRRAGREEMQ